MYCTFKKIWLTRVERTHHHQWENLTWPTCSFAQKVHKTALSPVCHIFSSCFQELCSVFGSFLRLYVAISGLFCCTNAKCYALMFATECFLLPRWLAFLLKLLAAKDPVIIKIRRRRCCEWM